MCIITTKRVCTVCRKALDLQALHLYNASNGPISVGFYSLMSPRNQTREKKRMSMVGIEHAFYRLDPTLPTEEEEEERRGGGQNSHKRRKGGANESYTQPTQRQQVMSHACFALSGGKAWHQLRS